VESRRELERVFLFVSASSFLARLGHGGAFAINRAKKLRIDSVCFSLHLAQESRFLGVTTTKTSYSLQFSPSLSPGSAGNSTSMRVSPSSSAASSAVEASSTSSSNVAGA